MRQFTLLSSIRLRFKRWSRVSYAAFMSIGREVTIGRLSVDIANSSTSKSMEGKLFNSSREEESESRKGSDTDEQRIEEQHLSMVLVVCDSAPVQCSSIYINSMSTSILFAIGGLSRGIFSLSGHKK